MQKYILKISIIVTSLLGFLIISPVVTNAATTCDATTTAGALQCGSDNGAGVPQGTDSTGTLQSTIKSAVNVASTLVGAVAVIMIIVGGFRYVTSAGNAETAKGARNTILYAVIGLVIVALAQIIVHFVLNNVNSA